MQFQIHYSNHTGDDVKDSTSIGLVFAKEPVKHEIAQYEIWNNLFLIPPGDENHRVTSCYTLPKDVIALAYTGHMHFRGKSITTEAIFPDGRHEVGHKVGDHRIFRQFFQQCAEPRSIQSDSLGRTQRRRDDGLLAAVRRPQAGGRKNSDRTRVKLACEPFELQLLAGS